MTQNKHLASDLKQMQSLPLEIKIEMTKRRIREWYEHWDGMAYVSFSGGKDSTVLKHIVDSMYDDVPALFVNTGLEYPEIQKFAMSQKNVVTVRPEMRFDEVIKKYGYPVFSKEVALNIEYGRKAIAKGNDKMVQRYLYGKRRSSKTGEIYTYMPLYKAALDLALNSNIPVSSECCRIMKKTPAKKYAKETGRKPIIGTLAEESYMRYQKWLKVGCNAFEEKEPISNPLSFWTNQDILLYLKKYNVPYCSVYGDIVAYDADGNEYDLSQDYLDAFDAPDCQAKLKTTGCDRTGCIFCMFGCHLGKEPNRFQRLKQTHPKQYQYCIGGGQIGEDGMWQPSKEGLGLGKVLDYIGVKYD